MTINMPKRSLRGVVTFAVTAAATVLAPVAQRAIIEAVQSVLDRLFATLHVEVAHTVSQTRAFDGLVHDHKTVRACRRVLRRKVYCGLWWRSCH